MIGVMNWKMEARAFYKGNVDLFFGRGVNCRCLAIREFERDIGIGSCFLRIVDGGIGEHRRFVCKPVGVVT